MAAKPRRKNLTREARREQILQAAVKAFSRGGYHGTHVLGTICGTGSVNNALRGTSPYLGATTTQRPRRVITTE